MNAEKLRKLNHKSQDDRYFNRELSWLAFNFRVLEESRRSRTPLLDRCRFLTICYSNLDEFFMVRVAGKKRSLRQGSLPGDSPDQMSIPDTLARIHEGTKRLVEDMGQIWNGELLPELKAQNIRLEKLDKLEASAQETLAQYYRETVLPVLTPLAVDPAHPFPFLANRRLYLVVVFKLEKEESAALPPIAFVEVPNVLPRLLPVNTDPNDRVFVMMEDLIATHLDTLFFGMPITAAYPIRVTRNLDFKLMESQVVDLLSSVQTEVKARDQAEAVRLEYGADLLPDLRAYLELRLGLSPEDSYALNCPLSMSDVTLYEIPRDDLKFPSFNPRLPPRMNTQRSIFGLIREEDMLLHHPFESFYAVIELLHTAAWDPDVLAIKQTLYRTSGDSPIIDALILAAEQGKQVTAVVELKARFDESNNITWARRMERAGVHVVYGFVGLKTHCKMTLIVRREDNLLHRYVHLSTGNYNSTTARHYVDIGYITARPAFGEDASLLFNMLTGFNILSRETEGFKPMPSPLHKLIVAPLYLRDELIRMINREIQAHEETGDGLIFAKMNSLVDSALIEKLYEASRSGVRIRLIVRGICCLRPGAAGLSENIEVISIVGRFLEHSRIFYFRNKGANDVYLGSADWMPRNMDRRIEVIFPIDDAKARNRIIKEIIPTYWADTENAWQLHSDGAYTMRSLEAGPKWDSQQKFIEIAREQGIKSLPYDKAIRHDLKRKGRPIVKKVGSRKTVKSED
ncbi:polyphosphate kinase 1 [Oligoflexus tunisiensis]|uniref:polyphosphate kinase 1 n=1 Tax=Oligoflexus tunisiensis TaxID=708132 RepID=UPI00159F2439|nr:polyphosphate kinase 1 [Oligoflexus tunisiensis]